MTSFSATKEHVHTWIASNKDKIRKGFPRRTWLCIYELMNNPSIPIEPNIAFENQWQGWKDWMGKLVFPDSDANNTDNNADQNPEPDYVIVRNDYDAKWNQKLKSLWEHYLKEGSFIVPSRNRELQQWVNIQRSNNKNHILNSERRRCLESINFDFEPQNHDIDDYFPLLIAFKKIHGHVDVPSRYHGNYKLAAWVHLQRVNYHKGTLSKWRIEKLENIGFRWSIPESERCLTLEERNKK